MPITVGIEVITRNPNVESAMVLMLALAPAGVSSSGAGFLTSLDSQAFYFLQNSMC